MFDTCDVREKEHVTRQRSRRPKPILAALSAFCDDWIFIAAEDVRSGRSALRRQRTPNKIAKKCVEIRGRCGLASSQLGFRPHHKEDLPKM